MARRMVGMYRCCNCGNLFEESEIMKIKEDRGEFWGFPCHETMYYSPCCMDDFEEAYEADEEDEFD